MKDGFMGKIVYGYQSPLSEAGENYANDINRLLEEAGIDPESLYHDFLSCPDNQKIDFFDKREVGCFRESVKNYVFLYWRLTLLEQSGVNREVKAIVSDIMFELADVYNFGYSPHPGEMAQGLRKGTKNDSTQVMRSLIKHLLPSNPIAQNIALTLIQPTEFERYQLEVNGIVHLKAITEKCEDGRVLWFREFNGKEKPYKLRSLEILIGKVKKELDNSK